MSSTAAIASPFQSYVYAYPHKTAYRPFPRPIPLSLLWADEPRDALFLYVHVPFCEFRCGFCNLFTNANPTDDTMSRWLATLERQARRVKAELGTTSFARFAIGGGTPTQLTLRQLERVTDLAVSMGAPLGKIPVSVEVSPDTVDASKLALLEERGATRISIGVQSFIEAEAMAVSRPQKNASVERALDLIRSRRFRSLNVDLIYGLPGQTEESWLFSLRTALRWKPEEVYLYPLYVRPLTGLGLSGRAWDDQRLSLLRAGRQHLIENGYEQVSMRMFRLRRAPADEGPVYCCQEDGMVGLGVGARSYTRRVHYSSEYAVGAKGTRAILESWLDRPDESFGVAEYGFVLDESEQRRRYALQSLLQKEGLDLAAYERRFGTSALADLELPGRVEGGRLRLSDDELAFASDAIGPSLYSPSVKKLMSLYELR